jgi:hypothetical protein
MHLSSHMSLAYRTYSLELVFHTLYSHSVASVGVNRREINVVDSGLAAVLQVAGVIVPALPR